MTEKPEASAAKMPKRQPAASLAAAYFVARLGVFLVILAIFWVVGFRGLPGALAAAILSIPVSFFTLGRMRQSVAIRMDERRAEQQNLKDEFRDAGKPDKQ